uniref:Uncharacterized protein n=1 Tax=Medicago truncatula TaxID=3880 RepID=I3S0Q4_MEDTR|nr:unknown [Medicago truncatula]
MLGFTSLETWEEQKTKHQQHNKGRKSNLQVQQPQTHQNQSNPTKAIQENLTTLQESLTKQTIESTTLHHQTTQIFHLNHQENHHQNNKDQKEEHQRLHHLLHLILHLIALQNQKNSLSQKSEQTVFFFRRTTS